jgi:hypothetical protein
LKAAIFMQKIMGTDYQAVTNFFQKKCKNILPYEKLAVLLQPISR